MRRILIGLFLVLLWTQPSWATTRYVSLTGSDANSCAASATISTPKLTFASAKTCLAAGDTLYVRAGTWTTQLDSNGVSGTANSPITIAAYPGETVTIRTTNFARPFKQYANQGYIVYDGFVFDGVNAGDGNVTSTGLFITSSMHHITVQNMEIKNWQSSGVYVDASNVTIKNNRIHNQVAGCGGTCSDRWYGVYFHSGSNGVIEGNDIYANPGGGIQAYPGPIAGLIIRNNAIHENNTVGGSLSPVGGITFGTGSSTTVTGGVIAHNLVYGNGTVVGTTDAKGIAIIGSGTSGTIVYGNTVYNNRGWGLYNGAGTPVNTKWYNNISLANATGQHTNGGTGEVFTTNKITGTITDCTVSTSDFTQKSGSSCIDAGTALTGFSYNVLPDIGAYETVVQSVCTVEDGDASTLHITFENNVYPPLLPATGITGFTARKALANDPVTTAVRVGDTQVYLTLTNAIVGGNAVDVSYASGNLTDSALIGGTLNQGFHAITNQSCTNNVSAPAAHIFTQAAFEFHGLRGTEAAPVGTPYATAPENTNVLMRAGGSVRLRIAITCTTADCPPTGFFPRYSKNGGAYTVVPDVFGVDNIAFVGTGPDANIPTNGTATTDQLSTSGTFVAGALVRTSNAIPTVDLAQNGKTELEYVFTFDTDAVVNDTYDIRVYQQDGTGLNAYTVTPRMTIMAPSAGMGF